MECILNAVFLIYRLQNDTQLFDLSFILPGVQLLMTKQVFFSGWQKSKLLTVIMMIHKSFTYAFLWSRQMVLVNNCMERTGVTHFGSSVHKTLWREPFSTDIPCKVEFTVTQEHVKCHLKGLRDWNTKRPWKGVHLQFSVYMRNSNYTKTKISQLNGSLKNYGSLEQRC